MYDIHLHLTSQPASLAEFGEVMAAHGISLEGGGVFTTGGLGHAHFLVKDGAAARAAAEAAGFAVASVQQVEIYQLDQERPGQLGAVARAIANAGVNILTQYSDHANRLILVTDDPGKAAIAARSWAVRQ